MKRWHRLLRAVAGGALLLLTLVGCGFFSELVDDGDSAPKRRLDASKITDAVPRVEAKSARGNHSPYTVFGQQYRVWPSVEGYRQRGEASWYGVKFHGRLTSSGERYDMYKMTAAHKHLPLPSYVEVKNLDNGRRTIVRVNDRGPFHGGRIIDLSYAAATKLGMLKKGTARVEVVALDPREWRRQQRMDKRKAPAPPVMHSSKAELMVSPAVLAEQPAGPPIESAAPEVGQVDAVPVDKASGDVSGGASSEAVSENLSEVRQAVRREVAVAEDVQAAPRWYLQLAAYRNLSAAGAAQQRLMALAATLPESPGVIVHATLAPQPLYRVRIGPLSSRHTAEQIKQHSALDSFANMYPVVE